MSLHYDLFFESNLQNNSIPMLETFKLRKSGYTIMSGSISTSDNVSHFVLFTFVFTSIYVVYMLG